MESSRDRLEERLQRLAARADEEKVFSRLYVEPARAAADGSGCPRGGWDKGCAKEQPAREADVPHAAPP